MKSILFNLILLSLSSAVVRNFGDDLIEEGKNVCKPSTHPYQILESKFPKLSECYKETLYYSTVADVCRENCRDVTIAASNYLVRECNLGSPDEGNTVSKRKYLVHSVWSNEESYDLACNRKNTHHGICLNELIRASVKIKERLQGFLKSNARQTLKPILNLDISSLGLNKLFRRKDAANNNDKKGRSDKPICTECIRSMIARFRNRPHDLPVVYYARLVDPASVFDDLAEYCAKESSN